MGSRQGNKQSVGSYTTVVSLGSGIAHTTRVLGCMDTGFSGRWGGRAVGMLGALPEDRL